MTLEELIRDRAEKGEFVHLSLWHEISSGLWCATYAPAHEFGNSIARDQDPVRACEQAITQPKSSKRRVTAAVKDAPPVETPPSTVTDEQLREDLAGLSEPAPPKPDTLDSWLPRA